ncbi:MAG: hypothetical protein Q9227_008678 [Pyrenula ochraceoflavens]
MFAVPGWAVSAENLVTQKGDRENNDTNKEHTRPNKKRKRNGEVKVTANNLDGLWKKHFEPEISKNDGAGKKKNKRKKKEGDAATDQEHSAEASLTTSQSSQQNSLNRDRNLHAKKKGNLRDDNKTNARSEYDTAASKSEGDHAEIGEALPVRSERKRKRRYDSQPQARSTESLEKAPDPRNRQVNRPKQNKKEHGIQAELSDVDNPKNATPLAEAGASKTLTTSKNQSLTPLQQRMRSRLISARFRHLNETLYTTPSSETFSLFSSSPDLFADYHAGFAQQVKESWPVNPVDVYIDNVRARAKIPFKLGGRNETHGILKDMPLPRRKNGTCTIADLGCGDARLARTLQSQSKNLNLRFHSFDLQAQNQAVTQADIAHLPLRDGEADVAVFCLSLMGTNWVEFVEEAWRVLRGDGRGECWVGEVKSRFGRVEKRIGKDGGRTSKRQEKQQGRKGQGSIQDANNEAPDEEVYAENNASNHQEDETDISVFVNVFQRRGFTLKPGTIDRGNKMFVSMIFVKAGVPSMGRWTGMKWTGAKYERVNVEVSNVGKRQFLDKQGDGLTIEDEAKVLKPCVYKLR